MCCGGSDCVRISLERARKPGMVVRLFWQDSGHINGIQAHAFGKSCMPDQFFNDPRQFRYQYLLLRSRSVQRRTLFSHRLLWRSAWATTGFYVWKQTGCGPLCFLRPAMPQRLKRGPRARIGRWVRQAHIKRQLILRSRNMVITPASPFSGTLNGWASRNFLTLSPP